LRIPSIVALAIPFLAVFITMIPPYWSTGILGQHRTVNVALFLFLPTWGLALAVCEERFSARGRWRFPWSTTRFSPMLGVLLLTFLLLGGNDKWVTRELLDGTLRGYDRHMHERHQLLSEAVLQDAAEVHLPALPRVPMSLRPLEPGSDPTAHWNQVLGEYYGAPGMRVVVGPAGAAGLEGR
jgi:hypothetical protein